MTQHQPRILQVNVSRGGVPKTAIPAGRITTTRVDGDDWNDKRHHGIAGQAVLMVSAEMISELIDEGFPLFPGALGENLTTAGLDFRKVRIGQVYQVGSEARLVITKVRQPCQTIAVYGKALMRATYDQAVQQGDVSTPKWGRSGFYAGVVREGTVYPGDPIILTASEGI